MNPQQKAFLEHIGNIIPTLFEAIRLGNVKSECVLGDRLIGRRQVRLKLVAEVVDAGSNPLGTHSQIREVGAHQDNTAVSAATAVSQNSSWKNEPVKQDRVNKDQRSPPRRGPRRKHPLAKNS